jgi:1-acyl-sn-glycerol-3-phosphate acyltransferase
MLRASGARVHIKGRENIPAGNALFIGNHQSNIDILLVLSSIQKVIGFIAKKELFSIPLLSFWMKYVGCILIDRKSMRKSALAIEKGAENLKKGASLVIFPEGHRSKGPTMASFKKGSLKLATMSGAMIVPMTISGTYHVYEEHNRIIPADVYLTIHPPIHTDNLTEEEKDGLSDRVEQIIKQAL